MKIFVSSSIKGLDDLRDVLYLHLKNQHTPWFSEKPDFPTHRHPDAMTNCILVVEECELFVLILDKRGGLIYSETQDSPYPDFFGMLITEAEYQCAKKKGKPICVFVRTSVENECRLYRQAKEKGLQDTMRWYADLSIYDFYDRIMHEEHVPWRNTFDSVTDIFEPLNKRIIEVQTLHPNLNVLYKKLLKVPSCWDIVSIDGDIATVSDGTKIGITPFKNHNITYQCSRCGNYGPWDGIRCLSCGIFEPPF